MIPVPTGIPEEVSPPRSEPGGGTGIALWVDGRLREEEVHHRMPVIDSETKAMRAFQALREDPNALERLAAKGVRNLLLASGGGPVIDAVTAPHTLHVGEIGAPAASA